MKSILLLQEYGGKYAVLPYVYRNADLILHKCKDIIYFFFRRVTVLPHALVLPGLRPAASPMLKGLVVSMTDRCG